jgi:hypothetical protein
MAKAHHMDVILQVAFYRPDGDEWKLDAGGKIVSFPLAVVSHFPRRLEQIKALGRVTGVEIEVFRESFDGGGRQEYIGRVISKIREYSPRRIIAFLDPDTGLARKRPDLGHVNAKEVTLIFQALNTRDWLVLYQHARRQRNWIESAVNDFSNAVGIAARSIETYRCLEVAGDVALLAARKPW